MAQVTRLLEILGGRKGEGITGVGTVLNFIHRRVLPIKDRVHPGSESASLWTEEEMIHRVKSLFAGHVEVSNEGCPPAYSLKRPADEVSLPSLFDSCFLSGFLLIALIVTWLGHFQGLLLRPSSPGSLPEEEGEGAYHR